MFINEVGDFFLYVRYGLSCKHAPTR